MPEPEFADDADGLTLAHFERHAVDRLDVTDGAAKEAALDREPDAQVLGAGDGRRARVARRRLSLRLGGEKGSGIRVLRMGEDVRHRPGFDDLAPLHHDHVVGDAAHDIEIVGDEQHRHADLLLQVFQQLQDLRLHGDVERGRRLVGDEKVRAVGERHRDHHPLALAA